MKTSSGTLIILLFVHLHSDSTPLFQMLMELLRSAACAETGTCQVTLYAKIILAHDFLLKNHTLRQCLSIGCRLVYL